MALFSFLFKRHSNKIFFAIDEIFIFWNNNTPEFDSTILQCLHLAEENTNSNIARNFHFRHFDLESASSRRLWLDYVIQMFVITFMHINIQLGYLNRVIIEQTWKQVIVIHRMFQDRSV